MKCSEIKSFLVHFANWVSQKLHLTSRTQMTLTVKSPSDVRGRTPLIIAALFNRVNLVKILLSHEGVKTKVQDGFGETALSYISHRWDFRGGDEVIKNDIVVELTKRHRDNCYE